MRQKKALYQKHLEESGGVYFSFCVYQKLVAVTSDRVTVGLCLSFPSCNVTAAVGRSVNRDITHLGIIANRGISPDCQAPECVGMTLSMQCGVRGCGSANLHVYKPFSHCAGEQL